MSYLELIPLSRATGDHQDRSVLSGSFEKSFAPRILASALLFSVFACLLFTSGCGITYNTLPLTVQPNSISFGDVTIGQSQMATVSVSNPGYTAVSVSGVQSGDAAFAPTGLARSIPAGGTSTFQVTFAPSTSKSYSSDISISTASGTIKMPVSGTGHQVSTPNPPTSNSTLSVSTTSLQFGNETVGIQAQQSLTLTAVGNAQVDINSITLSGGSFQAVTPALPATLKAGQSLTMPVQFIPKSAGSVQGMLTIASDAVNTPTVAVSLSGIGVIPTSAGVPALTLSPANLTFGTVPIGSHAVSSVTLTSSGTANLVLRSLNTAGAGFSIGSIALPLTLTPGQQFSLPVTFAPGAVGGVQGQIAIVDNAPTGASTIVLSGTGATAGAPSIFANPTSLDFGDQTVASSSFKTITLVSNGAVPVTVKSVTVSGQDFTGAVQGLPAVLQPNQQLSVKVQFTPAVAGQASGTVTIVTDAASPTTVVNVQGTGVAPKVGSLAASATSLSFGNVTTGTTATKTLTVTSTGTAAATISAGSISGNGFIATYGGVPIQSLAGPITLQPGQQANIAVSFDPVNTGSAAGQLTLQTDTGSPLNVSLTGVGTAAPSPALTISAPSLDFGDVQLNTQATGHVTLTSSGTAPVTISSTAIAGAQFGIASSSFPPGITGLPATLNPGQQMTLTVSFLPTATGAVTGDLTVSSNASGGATNVALTGSGILGPVLTASPTSVSFGNVTLNSGVTQPLTLTSSGAAPVTISATTVSGAGFTVSGSALPLILNPGQTTTLQLTFDPTIAGAATGNLTINSNATSGTIQVALSGTGMVPASPQLMVSPTSLAFGNVTLNTTSSLAVTLSSTGTAPVTVSAATLSGTGFVASGAVFPVTINPGLAVTIQVQFDPTVAGAASGRLTVTSNSATNSTAVVQITGTGMAVQHSIDLSWNAPTTSTDPVAGYNIYRSTDGGATFTRLNASPETVLLYTDSNVQSGTTYTYVATSVDANGQESGPSNQISLPVP